MSHIQTSSDSDDLKRPRITFMQNTHYVSPPHNFRIDCLFPESHPPSKRNRISLSRPAEINYVGPLMKPHVNNSSRLRYRAKKKKKSVYCVQASLLAIDCVLMPGFCPVLVYFYDIAHSVNKCGNQVLG